MLTFFLSFSILVRMLGPSAYTYSNALCWGLCAEHARASDETTGPRKWAHLTLYVLEFFPILGQLVSLIEVAASRCFTPHPKPQFQPPVGSTISTRFLRAAQAKTCLMIKLNDLFYITYAPQDDAQKHLFYLKAQEMQPQAIVSFISSHEQAAFLQPRDELTDLSCSCAATSSEEGLETHTVTFASFGGTSWKIPHYLITKDGASKGLVMERIKNGMSTSPIIMTYTNDSFVYEPTEFAALYEGHMGYRTRMNAYQTKLEEHDT